MALLKKTEENDFLAETLEDHLIFLTSNKFTNKGKAFTPRFGLYSKILELGIIYLYDNPAFKDIPKGFVTENNIFLNSKYFDSLIEEDKNDKSGQLKTCAFIIKSVNEFLTGKQINESIERTLQTDLRLKNEKEEKAIDKFISSHDFINELIKNNEDNVIKLLYGNKITKEEIETHVNKNNQTFSTVIENYIIKNDNENKNYDTVLGEIKDVKDILSFDDVELKAKQDWENNKISKKILLNAFNSLENEKYCNVITDLAISENRNKTEEERKKVWSKMGKFLNHFDPINFSSSIKNLLKKLQNEPEYTINDGNNNNISVTINIKKEICKEICDIPKFDEFKRTILISAMSHMIELSKEPQQYTQRRKSSKIN